MKEPWGRFANLRVADEVFAVVDGRAALLGQLAGAGPTVHCGPCDQLASIATTALSLLAQTATGDPQAPGLSGSPLRISAACHRRRSCTHDPIAMGADRRSRTTMIVSCTPGWRSKGSAMRPSWPCSAARTWTSSILTNGGAFMPSGRPSGRLTTQASQTPDG